MQSICRLVSVQILFIFMVGCSGLPFSGENVAKAKPLDLEAVESADVKNLINPEINMFAGGQPTKAQLETLADAGIQHVVNLRAATEMEWDEQEIVESLGMSYYSLPVDGDPDITIESARSLRNILDSIGSENVLLHDGSGGRVGALMAIDAAIQNGGDVEQAVATGKYWGLSGRIEPTVRVAIAK